MVGNVSNWLEPTIPHCGRLGEKNVLFPLATRMPPFAVAFRGASRGRGPLPGVLLAMPPARGAHRAARQYENDSLSPVPYS